MLRKGVPMAKDERKYEPAFEAEALYQGFLSNE
jgi:hypothetical protein